MIDLRRIAIIFVIAILYAIFVNAFIGAIYQSPKYEDYCKEFYANKIYVTPDRDVTCTKFNQPTEQELEQCVEQGGQPDYRIDANGYRTAYKGCNFCQRDFDLANQKYNFAYFILSSILAIIGIVIGLFLPQRNSLNQWIATGFMLGGLIALFFGTFRYYEHLGRFIKPIVILLEIALVIYLSYKKLQDKKR